MSDTKFLIKEISFEECLPLLKELWPDMETILPVDNIFGLIDFTKKGIAKIKPKFFAAQVNDRYVACTHAYMTNTTDLRIRGTYCQESFRRSGIAKEVCLYAIKQFTEARMVYTFPRIGAEKFYENLGFSISSQTWPIYKGIKFGKMYIQNE